MVFLGVWFALSLLFGTCWALAGLLLGARQSARSIADESPGAEEGEAA